MSNSIIICEGSTDYVILQYYMEKVHNWINVKKSNYHYKEQKGRLLTRDSNSLTIAPSGGCTELTLELEDILFRNTKSSGNEFFDKIVLITDNDDVNENSLMEDKINKTIAKFDSKFSGIKNNTWIDFDIKSDISHENVKCQFLPLIIPFDEDGALETFLLTALSNSNEYDKKIINNSNQFVEDVSKIQNPNKMESYLEHRRYRTKAKFDVYFSIRTPYEQFNLRRDIIRGIEWEKYSTVRSCFSELSKL